ncbi:MAG: ATP-binding protein [Gammaproteobacteria bacterium]
MDELERLKKRCAKEKKARKRAEALLKRRTVELNQLNQDLVEREKASRSILEATGDGIIIADASGKIEMFNRAAQLIFGYMDDAAIGRRVDDLIRFEDAEEEFIDYVEASIHEPVCTLHETIGVQSDGATLPIELTINKVEFSGKAKAIVSVRDISRRREAEEEWINMDIQLRQAQKLEAIGQLAAGIAHEINTPIQFVGDNARFIRDSFAELERYAEVLDRLVSVAKLGQVPTELFEEAAQLADEIDYHYLREEIPQAIEQSMEGIERVAGIVRAMKEFSHPDVDEKTPIDLNAAIQTTIMVCRNEWKYDAEMETDLDPDLPLVPCLPGEINQVILNIIVNAAHAIRDVIDTHEGEKGTIRIITRRLDYWAEITISDTGAGMSDKIISRIFDPFFTTKEVGKGTGQGLTIAYTVVVEKHGGTINVESQVGKGSTFTIRLPLV